MRVQFWFSNRIIIHSQPVLPPFIQAKSVASLCMVLQTPCSTAKGSGATILLTQTAKSLTLPSNAPRILTTLRTSSLACSPSFSLASGRSSTNCKRTTPQCRVLEPYTCISPFSHVLAELNPWPLHEETAARTRTEERLQMQRQEEQGGGY